MIDTLLLRPSDTLLLRPFGDFTKFDIRLFEKYGKSCMSLVKIGQVAVILLLLLCVCVCVCTRAFQKVSSRYEYLENRSRRLDVTWQPVKRRPYCASVNIHSSVGLVSRQ
jgi:hypothetical protein